jgi:hypothetical protein
MRESLAVLLTGRWGIDSDHFNRKFYFFLPGGCLKKATSFLFPYVFHDLIVTNEFI